MRLTVHHSNQVEALADALVSLPLPAGTDPFAREVIALQSRGMARWLSMQLAQQRGICANLEFDSPEELMTRTMVACGTLPPGQHDPWAPGRLRWTILELLSQTDAPALAALADYLGADGATDEGAGIGRRAVLLAGRIANVFHRYTLYRPDMLDGWDRGDGDGGDWQPTLWRLLSQALTVPHPGKQLQHLLEALQSGVALASDFPSRVIIFGVNTLPPKHVEVLRALATRCEVHLFIMSPAMSRQADAVPLHPMADSFDRLGRDLELLLSRGEAQRREHFRDPGRTSALRHLQADIAEGVIPEQPKVVRVSPTDRSLQLHACHGAMRQVEVLRDELLALFDADQSLEPRDVIVMTPDIETYAPLIDAVFSDGDPDLDDSDPRSAGFPPLHRIHDLSLRRSNPWAEAFIAILDLASGRLAASEVIEVLSMPPVMNAVGLDTDELGDVRDWLRTSGIRWGRDARDRQAHGQPPDPANTWRFGFDRLLVGHAIAADGPERFAGVHPVDDVEGTETEALGRAIDYLERLFDILEALPHPRTLPEWRDCFNTLLEALLRTDDDSAGHCQLIIDEVTKLVDRASEAGFGGRLGFDAARALLDGPFKARRPSVSFLSGGLTFCTMVPMRNLPFRVVCLLGMDDGRYPRKAYGMSFDVVEREPRVGDRSPREDDRAIFLETLLAARDHLIVTYAGRGATDNRARAPAAPVAELREILVRTFGAGRSELDPPWPIHNVHPLHPFSPANYGVTPSGRAAEPLSFDRRYLSGAAKLLGQRDEVPPFGPVEVDQEPLTALELDDLREFLSDPSTWFCRAQLGLSRRVWEQDQRDREPISPDALERWSMTDEMLGWRLDGLPTTEIIAALRGTGKLPLGMPGDRLIGELDVTANAIAQRVGEVTAGAMRNVSIDLQLAGVNVTGVIGRVHDGGHLAYRAGRGKAKHMLALWVAHLALSVGDPDFVGTSALVAKDGIKRLGPLPRHAARQHLRDLVQIFSEGQRVPARFFPDTSLAFAKDVLSDKLPGRNCQRAWFDDPPWLDGPVGDSTEPHVTLLHGDVLPVDDPVFRTLAVRIYRPLLSVLTEEKL